MIFHPNWPLMISRKPDLRTKVFPNVDAGATYIDSDTGLESMSSADATTKACSLCLDGVDRAERSTNGGGSVISVSVGTGSTGGDSTRELRSSTGSSSGGVVVGATTTTTSVTGGGGGHGSVTVITSQGAVVVGPEIVQQMDGYKQEITRLKCDKLDLLRQNVVSCILVVEKIIKAGPLVNIWSTFQ